MRQGRAWFKSRTFRVGVVLVLMAGWVAVWALLSRFHPERQFWHDVWAGTRLIDVQPDGRKRRGQNPL